jgi:hypothetical protein
MMMRRGLGDSPEDYSAPIDVGQVATWGWYGVALALAIVYFGPRLLGGGKKKRR